MQLWLWFIDSTVLITLSPLSYLLFPTALLRRYHVQFINGSSFPDKETVAELSDCPSLRAVAWQSCKNTDLCGIKEHFPTHCSIQWVQMRLLLFFNIIIIIF